MSSEQRSSFRRVLRTTPRVGLSFRVRPKTRVFCVNLQFLPWRGRSLPDPRNLSPQAGTALWKRNGMLATLRPAAEDRFFTEPVFRSKCPEKTLM
jgi:hypothetical protein